MPWSATGAGPTQEVVVWQAEAMGFGARVRHGKPTRGFGLDLRVVNVLVFRTGRRPLSCCLMRGDTGFRAVPERLPALLRAQDFPWGACSKGLRRSLFVFILVSALSFVPCHFALTH